MVQINLPATMKIEAKEKAVRFTPYKENFVVPVAAGSSLALKAETVGQYLYYIKQGFVEDAAATKDTVDIFINSPAKITVANNSTKTISFIPYRENFQQEVEAGEGYEFVVKTAGQVLYYIAQDTNGIEVDGGLDVTQEAASTNAVASN